MPWWPIIRSTERWGMGEGSRWFTVLPLIVHGVWLFTIDFDINYVYLSTTIGHFDIRALLWLIESVIRYFCNLNLNYFRWWGQKAFGTCSCAHTVNSMERYSGMRWGNLLIDPFLEDYGKSKMPYWLSPQVKSLFTVVSNGSMKLRAGQGLFVPGESGGSPETPLTLSDDGEYGRGGGIEEWVKYIWPGNLRLWVVAIGRNPGVASTTPQC